VLLNKRRTTKPLGRLRRARSMIRLLLPRRELPISRPRLKLMHLQELKLLKRNLMPRLLLKRRPEN